MITQPRKCVSVVLAVLALSCATTSYGQRLPEDLAAEFSSGRYSDLQFIPPLFTTPSDLPIRQFEFLDNQTGEEMFLLEYEIGGDSARDFTSNEFDSNEPVNQLFWVTARQRYDANFSAQVTLYHDVQPFFGRLEPTTQLQLSTDALVAGTAQTGTIQAFPTFDPFDEPPIPSGPPMLVQEGFFSCLSEGCYHRLSFNLVGLEYQESDNGELVGSLSPLLTTSTLTGQDLFLIEIFFPEFVFVQPLPENPLLYRLMVGFPGFSPDDSETFSSTTSLFVSPLMTANNGADFNGDGSIDCDDIDQYAGNLGFPATGHLAILDLIADGSINTNDFTFMVESLVTTSNGRTGTFMGDLNCDGQVNVLGDAFILVGNLGTTVMRYSAGDINLDGRVDILGDAIALVGNLGSSNE